MMQEQEAGGRPLGGWEGAEGGIMFLGERRGAPLQGQGLSLSPETPEGSQPGRARAQERCQPVPEKTPRA